MNLMSHVGIFLVLISASNLSIHENGAASNGAATASEPGAAHSQPDEGDQKPEVRRAPLLREGSFLTQVSGDVTRDVGGRQWLFTLAERNDRPRHEFILLPSQGLDDIVRVAEDPRQAAVFELTGEIFVYAGRNYLLPILATPLIDRVERKPGPQGSDESMDIERRLEERIGRVAHGAGPATGAEMSGNEGVSEVDGRLGLRRGSLVRNGVSGGWRFVFEADATGKRDPEVDLLPCLALEGLERMARQSDGPLVLELGGRVLSSQGHSYLLPTRYRIPVHSTPLQLPTPAGAR